MPLEALTRYRATEPFAHAPWSGTFDLRDTAGRVFASSPRARHDERDNEVTTEETP